MKKNLNKNKKKGISKNLVWIITVGEPLPLDQTQRLHRHGQFIKSLENRSDIDIVWWTNNFDHFNKKKITIDKKYKKNNLKIKQIKSIGYKKNISILRFIDNIFFSIKLFIFLLFSKKPSTILCSFPPIEQSFVCLLISKIFNVSLVLDVRDAWPDIFLEYFNKKYLIYIKILLSPWFLLTKIVFKYSDKIITITNEFSKWINSKIDIRKEIHVVNLSYNEQNDNLITNYDYEFWNKFNISKKDDFFYLVYIGSLSSKKINIKSALDLDNIITKNDLKIKFIFCGNYKEISDFHSNYENMIFPGWINQKQINSILEISNLGFSPYTSRWDFKLSLPSKISEYLSASLPIINSLNGETADLIEKHNLGLNFDINNKNELLEKIQYLKTNADIYNRMSNNGKIIFNQLFNTKITSKQFASIINI